MNISDSEKVVKNLLFKEISLQKKILQVYFLVKIFN